MNRWGVSDAEAFHNATNPDTNPDNEWSATNPWDVLQTSDGRDWQTEVANGDTVLGLMDWIDHNRK